MWPPDLIYTYSTKIRGCIHKDSYLTTRSPAKWHYEVPSKSFLLSTFHFTKLLRDTFTKELREGNRWASPCCYGLHHFSWINLFTWLTVIGWQMTMSCHWIWNKTTLNVRELCRLNYTVLAFHTWNQVKCCPVDCIWHHTLSACWCCDILYSWPSKSSSLGDIILCMASILLDHCFAVNLVSHAQIRNSFLDL